MRPLFICFKTKKFHFESSAGAILNHNTYYLLIAKNPDFVIYV